MRRAKSYKFKFWMPRNKYDLEFCKYSIPLILKTDQAIWWSVNLQILQHSIINGCVNMVVVVVIRLTFDFVLALSADSNFNASWNITEKMENNLPANHFMIIALPCFAFRCPEATFRRFSAEFIGVIAQIQIHTRFRTKLPENIYDWWFMIYDLAYN